MVYFQALSAAATDGNTVYDGGLRSTAENPKTLLSVLVQVTQLPLVGSMLQIWHEKEKIAEVPLNLIDCPYAGGQNYPYSRNRLNEIEVGMEIPVGATVKAASKAVGGSQTVVGAYRYEITT